MGGNEERLRSEDVVLVPMPKSLAIGVGHSLRALAQRDIPNKETAAQFKEAGEAMVEAARRASTVPR